MRAIAAPVCILAVAAAVLGAHGCAAPEEPVTVIIELRDDASSQDIDALASMLHSDERVVSSQCVHEDVMLTEEAAVAAGPPTDGPEGDPTSRAWLEFVVSGDSQDAVLATIETHPVFGRAVLVPSAGDWWQTR